MLNKVYVGSISRAAVTDNESDRDYVTIRVGIRAIVAEYLRQQRKSNRAFEQRRWAEEEISWADSTLAQLDWDTCPDEDIDTIIDVRRKALALQAAATHWEIEYNRAAARLERKLEDAGYSPHTIAQLYYLYR